MTKEQIKKAMLITGTIDNFIAALVGPILTAVIYPEMGKSLIPVYSFAAMVVSTAVSELLRRTNTLNRATRHFTTMVFVSAAVMGCVLVIGFFNPVLMMFALLGAVALAGVQEVVIDRIGNLFMSGEELTNYNLEKSRLTNWMTMIGSGLAMVLILIPGAYYIAIGLNFVFIVTDLYANLVLRRAIIKLVGPELEEVMAREEAEKMGGE